jgi:predicted HicB family RNase H-like nuclease
MSAKQKARVGRPPTGITKSRPSITMDKKVEKAARKAASLEGVSFSSWVERAVRENIAALIGKAGA